jgi:YD repeat-containing protein
MAKSLLVASALVLLWTSAKAGDLVPPKDLEGHFSDPEVSAEYSHDVLHYLNEFSARRRLTTLFPNEQSPFYGVQMNYVNVTRGNLTFLVRDLVRLDRIPIVFGRVYDSSKENESDFGPGWKLSVAESVRQVGGSLRYVDASNSEYELKLNGARISSAHPHLTGIRDGRLSATEIVFEVGALTKTFAQYGDAFRLVEIRDSSGNWISLSYSGEVIERISSSGERHVDIRRDAAGRIVGATDDAGRTVRYAYDSSGRLSESYDLAGETYRYSYNPRGYLAELIDPRGERNLTARFDDAGKVIVLSSQHDALTYQYVAGSTLVSNAMQQAARFWYHDTGLTETAQDFAGGVSSLVLDADLHVSQFRFDGADVASADYGGGRLLAIRRSNGRSFETQRFAYDARGRLLRIGEAGQPLARYGYDERGNVVFADDGSGERRYRYDRNGSLVGAEINEFRLEFDVNRIGLVEHVYWDAAQGTSHQHERANVGNGERGQQNAERLSLDISHNETDRVEALRFNTPAGSLASDYGYTPRGFRNLGRYEVLGRGLGQTHISLSYDAVGNLTEWTYPGPDGSARSTRHAVGPQNQLLVVTPVGQEEFEQTFDYDANGRPVRVAQGSRREARFQYDELSRLTDVYLDGEHVLTSHHGPMDVDPVHEGDAHTPFTMVDQPVASAVFGSLEEIAFARTAGTPYGFVRFVPSMARFIVRETLIAPPDAAVFASLKRRNLASRATLTPTLLGFDKPSSSLFIPPEYFSVNCVSCLANASGFDLDYVGSGTYYVGQTVGFVADAESSQCWTFHWVPPEYYWYYEQEERFSHEIDVNGSYVTTFYGPYGKYNHEYLEFGLVFLSPGLKTVTDTLRCAACPSVFMAQAQTTVQVVQPTCSVDFTLQSPNNFFISATPTMPTINANVSSLTPSNASVSWTAQITHTAPTGSGGPTFASSVVTGSGSSFSPTFGGFYGDDLTVTATCSAPGYQSSSTTKTQEIKGTQPSDAAIVAEIGSVTSPFDSADLRRIGCHESSLTQFAGTGMPLYGPGGDTGIMQIWFQRTADDLWNWPFNIATGRSTLSTDRNSAKNHLDAEVASGATPYSTQMWREDAIHKYNAGTGPGNEYWEWDANAAMWIIVDRGGVGGYTPAVLAQGATCT